MSSINQDNSIYNKNLLDSIREKLDDLTGGKYVKAGAGNTWQTEKLTNHAIAELLSISRSTFHDGLKIKDYLTFKLHHLYAALKRHENEHYKRLSSQVFIISVREVGKYLGINRNNVRDYIQILTWVFLDNQDDQTIYNSLNHS